MRRSVDNSASPTINSSSWFFAAHKPLPSRLIAMRRISFVSGRPTYVFQHAQTERTARRALGNNHPIVLEIGKDLRNSREDLASLGEDSEKAAIMALAFVAALAFLAGRRYLRR